MIEIGKFNDLEYIRKIDIGLVLSDGEDEALLPFNAANKRAEPGDTFSVFVYFQGDGRLLATTQTPLACAGEFACLQVIDEGEKGVFMDLGIEKDVFVHEREQKRLMVKGEKYVVYIYVDNRNDRLCASSRLSNFVQTADFDLEEGQDADLLIAEKSDLGYSAIINQKYIGLLYHNEVFEDLQIGEKRKGYIKKIREEDLIDLSLHPQGYKHILDTKESLLELIKENNGKLDLGDKSSPEEVYKQLKISKKAFKKTAGALYKERLIEISDYEIRLAPEE